ncbi:MAG: hypothetical protein ACOC55_04590 [Candidatus Natronoplasma sp.]
MDLKSDILSLEERMRWNNWPIWLKGLFILWPSIGPVYLFLFKTPAPTGDTTELNTLLTNIEYQNYFIVVFIGFWSINLMILGITWFIGPLIADGYRYHLERSSKSKPRTKDPKPKKGLKLKKLRKKHPF